MDPVVHLDASTAYAPRASHQRQQELPPIVHAIAPATPADVPEIHALIRALAEYERLAHVVVGTEAQLHDALFGPTPAAEVLLARVDDKIAGFALFYPTFSTFLARRGLWLEDLFVRPAYRGRGIGKALLVALAAIARARQCGRFEWNVLAWNTPAIGFYQSLGATLMEDWRLCRTTGDSLVALAGME
jgi:GNAT superfamily N-acetyltransferase